MTARFFEHGGHAVRRRFLRWLGYDGTLLIAIPLIVLPLAAFFFIRAALHTGEPHLQLVGHYAPIATAPLQVGTGPGAAIRLTESGIDDVEGWLRLGDRDFTYDHAAPMSVVRTAGTGVPIDRAVELGRYGKQATAVVNDGGRTATRSLGLFDASRLTLKTNRGNYSLALPEKEGHSLRIGGIGGTTPLWMSYCGGRPVWSTSEGCGNPVPFGSYFATWTGRLIDAAPPRGSPTWLTGAQVVFGSSEKNAYVQIGKGPLERVATPLQLELRAAAEPFVVWKRGPSSPVYISRTAPPGVTVTVTPGMKRKQATTVGTVEHLPYGSVLVLGSTPFRVTRHGDVVRLTATERRDRFHFFATLSSGRINFTNRGRRLRDALDSPTRRLNIIGVAARSAPPPVEPTGQDVAAAATWALPVPRWMHPAGASAAAISDLALATITPSPDGGHVRLQTQIQSPLHTHSGAIRDGDDTQLGGHIIRYARGVPLIEQIGPPVAFSFIALLVVLVLTIRISASVPRHATDLTPSIIVACTTLVLTLIAALLIAGVSLMSHMAAVDTLIGKTDYYHRQLFYSFVALSLAGAILFPTRESSNPWSVWNTFFPFSWRVIAACTVALVVWQLADAAMWVSANGWSALDQDTVRDALHAGIVALSVAAAVYAALVAEGHRTIVAGIGASVIAFALNYYGHLDWRIAWSVFAVITIMSVLHHLAGAVGEDGQPVRSKAHAAARFLIRHYSAPLKDFVILGTAIVILVLGVLPGLSSGRESAGVKPAEFAIWFLAIGLARMLTAQFRPTAEDLKPSQRPLWFFGALFIGAALTAWALRYMLQTILIWTLPPVLAIGIWAVLRYRAKPFSLGRWLRVIGFLVILVVLVTALYGGAGDFGPVLVLLPTVALIVWIWSLAPDREGQPGWTRLLAPIAVTVTLLWLAVSGLWFIHSEWAATRFGRVEGSMHRASKRLDTFRNPWYTKEGSWGVQAQWLANDFYGTREPMIANLHSDLAFVAALRAFGERYAVAALLGGYFVLIALPIIGAWVLLRRSADGKPPPNSDTNTRMSAIRRRLQSREAALLLFFAAIYLSFEVLIHVGSGFNAIPQTGVTLPWISSGGSAAVAFAGLYAIAFAHAVAVVKERA